MSIDDLRLRTKTLIPLGIMGLTVIAMVAFGASRLVGVSQSAGDIIENRDVAVFKIARAGRAIVQIPYAIDAAVLNDDKTPASDAAGKDIVEAPYLAQRLLSEAAGAAPDRAAALAKFRERVQELAQRAKGIFDASIGLPGVDRGAELTPAQIEGLAKATKAAAVIDTDARALHVELAEFNDKFVVENAAAAKALDAQAYNAVLTLCLLGALSALVATVFSFWMTSAKSSGRCSGFPTKCGRWPAAISRSRSRDASAATRSAAWRASSRCSRPTPPSASPRSRATEARPQPTPTRERAATERAEAAEQQTSAMRRCATA